MFHNWLDRLQLGVLKELIVLRIREKMMDQGRKIHQLHDADSSAHEGIQESSPDPSPSIAATAS